MLAVAGDMDAHGLARSHREGFVAHGFNVAAKGAIATELSTVDGDAQQRALDQRGVGVPHAEGERLSVACEFRVDCRVTEGDGREARL